MWGAVSPCEFLRGSRPRLAGSGVDLPVGHAAGRRGRPRPADAAGDPARQRAPFLLAWPGIILAAFLGGFWPAILVTALSVAVAQWVLVDGGGATLGPGAIAIYVAFGLVFAVAGGMRKRGIRRAKAYAERLAELQAQMVQVARSTPWARWPARWPMS